MTSHKPAATFWLTGVLVVVLVAYPLSFGPFIAIDRKFNGPD